MKTVLLSLCMAVLLLVSLILVPSLVYGIPAEGVTPINSLNYVQAVHKLFNTAQSNIRVMAYQAWFYEEYPDSDSNMFLQELIQARKRGVDVWVLLETSNWDQNLDEQNKDFAKRLEEAGVVVFFDNKELTSHQKVIIIDDYATVVSSHNWSHYSLRVNNEVAAIIWSREVAKSFFDYMNEMMKQAANPPLPETRAKKTVSKNTFDLYPAEDVVPLTNRLFFPYTHEAFQKAKKNIRVVQRSALYYTIIPAYDNERTRKPGDPISQVNILLKDLIDARKRGVDVQVVLDAEIRKRRSTGEWTVNSQNEDTAMRLLAGGVTVYYDSLTTQTHAKMVIVDDQAIVGSTNWTHNAVELGNEASVLIKSKPVSEVYYKYFDRLKENGVAVTPGLDLFSLKNEMEKKGETQDVPDDSE
jgi:phosphatidylserine/phosphatidylglycerophosphate/cardiolipin synthase-like enzyme